MLTETAVRTWSGPVVTTPPNVGAAPFSCSQGALRRPTATSRLYHADMVERVLLASPRGYCAGVERAVETVELALEHYGPPVYVRKQIVHNIHVVRDLEARGAIFVDSETEAPEGATIVYSAHGVAPAVNDASRALAHNVIDATCPLVTKVHVQARRYAAAGYTVLLIGHEGHEEVVGTMGEAPEATVLVQDVAEAEALDLPADARLAYITQTTLSVDETSEIIGVLRRRFPAIHAPKKEDICYATSNRQWAVKEMLEEVDLLLVIGSRNSSNSNRLVDVARAGGVASYLIDDAGEIDAAWMEGVKTVGVTSGASAPEQLVDGVCDWFRERGVERIEAVPDGRRGRHVPPPGGAPPRARAGRLAELGATSRPTRLRLGALQTVEIEPPLTPARAAAHVSESADRAVRRSTPSRSSARRRRRPRSRRPAPRP